MVDYFSDIYLGPKPLDHELISDTFWEGLVTIVELKLEDGSLGKQFPSF